MNTPPRSLERWGELWSQAQRPCTGDARCAGFEIFEQVRKAFATQRPGAQEIHPLGLLLTDLAVDHGACIRASLKDEALDVFCRDLSTEPNSTLGWAAAVLSTQPTKQPAKQPCICGRQGCRGGRKCGRLERACITCDPRRKCRGGRRCPVKNQRTGDQDGNASLTLRNSLEAVLHGCDDMPAIGSELLLAHARQKAQGEDARGLFITGLAGTFLALEGTPEGTANVSGTTHPAYMLAGEWRQAQARRRSWPALH